MTGDWLRAAAEAWPQSDEQRWKWEAWLLFKVTCSFVDVCGAAAESTVRNLVERCLLWMKCPPQRSTGALSDSFLWAWQGWNKNSGPPPGASVHSVIRAQWASCAGSAERLRETQKLRLCLLACLCSDKNRMRRKRERRNKEDLIYSLIHFSVFLQQSLCKRSDVMKLNWGQKLLYKKQKNSKKIFFRMNVILIHFLLDKLFIFIFHFHIHFWYLRVLFLFVCFVFFFRSRSCDMLHLQWVNQLQLNVSNKKTNNPDWWFGGAQLHTVVQHNFSDEPLLWLVQMILSTLVDNNNNLKKKHGYKRDSSLSPRCLFSFTSYTTIYLFVALLQRVKSR